MAEPNSPLPIPETQPAAGAQGMDLRRLFHVVLDRAWIVVSVFVVVGVLTFAHIQRSPLIYAATATLQVEQPQRLVKFESVMQEDMRSAETMRTIVQTLETRPLLERVAATNRLGDNLEQLAGMLKGLISVRIRSGTRLIDVTVENTDPALASQIANSLVQEFIRQGYEQESSVSDLATASLIREADRLKERLKDSENALQAYVADSKSVSLQERQDIVIPKLKELSSRLTEAKTRRIQQEADYHAVQQVGTNVAALLTLSAVANDPTVTGLRLNISRLEAEFATLKQRYRDEHPKYNQMQTQLEDLRGSMSNAVLRVRDFAAAAFESSKNTEEALAQAVREQEQAALDLNQQSIQYSVLSREVESDRAMYDAVLSRVKETSLTKELASYSVRIVEPALTPTYPIKPQKKTIIIRGLFLGLVAGVGLALLVNTLDNTFKTIDQVEQTLDLPVIGALPVVPDLGKDGSQVVLDETSKSAYAEAFRNLRASLSMLGRTEDRRVFLFTSALPQEGKTFCSVNYAISLAQQGLRTLLIDCDLRRPNVEKAILGKRKSTRGVTDFLAGKTEFPDLIEVTGLGELSLIGVGSHAPNPSELLAQGRFAKLIEEGLKRFDRIVIDSAPIQAVSDTLLIMEGVQTVCLTLHAGKTPRRAVIRALQTLDTASAPVAGIVLNFLKRERGGGYGYYYYYNYSEKPDQEESKGRSFWNRKGRETKTEDKGQPSAVRDGSQVRASQVAKPDNNGGE